MQEAGFTLRACHLLLCQDMCVDCGKWYPIASLDRHMKSCSGGHSGAQARRPKNQHPKNQRPKNQRPKNQLGSGSVGSEALEAQLEPCGSDVSSSCSACTGLVSMLI